MLLLFELVKGTYWQLQCEALILKRSVLVFSQASGKLTDRLKIGVVSFNDACKMFQVDRLELVFLIYDYAM